MTIKRLKIYHPLNRIKLDSRQITLLVLTALLLVSQYVKSNTNSYYEEIDLISFLVIILFFLYSLYFLISNLFAYEATPGFFQGHLIIENDKIICDNKVYLFDEIQKISILNDWIRGNHNSNILALEPKKSNGVKNYIEISLWSGQKEKFYFLQTREENLKMFIQELRTYYRFGKIGDQNYKNIENNKHYR